MSNIQDRIKKARIEHSMSAEEVAELLNEKGINISARTIYGYESGDRAPSVSYLQGLVKYLEINPTWLLSGNEDIFKNSTSSAPDSVLAEMYFIPLINLKLSAGFGSLIAEREGIKDYIALPKKLIESITSTATKHLLGFTVVGDSMVGEINEGDIVIVDETRNELGPEGTYAVNIDDCMYVKILQRMPGNKVRVVSRNDKYAPYTVNLDEDGKHFKIIGRVIWAGSQKFV